MNIILVLSLASVAFARDLSSYPLASSPEGNVRKETTPQLRSPQQKQQKRKRFLRQATPAQTLKPSFDFVVAGFPKCGTTSLLKAFEQHPETDMAASEQCAIASPGQGDAKVRKLLDGTLSNLSHDPEVKRSFKCPTAMYNYKSITRMDAHSPNAKFIVGMRHPVHMLQSFYNYRVTEIKERGLDEVIPSLNQVIDGSHPWKGVSLQSTRFELFLMQMGKTPMTIEQMNEFVDLDYDLAIQPTKMPVFLYTVDQLDDSNKKRSASFRSQMQEFLGLSQPIAPFGHENTNHATGESAYEETISICDEQWAPLRARLLHQGTKTAQWLRDSFLQNPEVHVANKEHFFRSLESWGTDPCTTTAEI